MDVEAVHEGIGIEEAAGLEMGEELTVEVAVEVDTIEIRVEKETVKEAVAAVVVEDGAEAVRASRTEEYP